ncbi:FISUMP domain-containing protein, partial [Bacteroidota bacterium]
MKSNNILFKSGLLLILLLSISLSVRSQTSVCVGEEVIIKIGDFRGSLTWEMSANNIDWSVIPDELNDSLVIMATDTMYYRAAVHEEGCLPYYSEICTIYINPEIDVEIADFNDVCLETDAVQLFGGSPSGGEYSGTGVIDGRFIPALAGVGNHIITYTVQSQGSECMYSDSATINVLPMSTIAYAGADSIGIAADSIILYGNTPETGSGTWRIISGENGSLEDNTDPNTIFRGNIGEYLLEWSINGVCGSTSDSVRIVLVPLTGVACPGTPVVVDIDGNIYPTVQIGTQCWMGANLNTGSFINSVITTRAHSDAYNNGIIEKYCYDNDVANCELYGGLYDWNEMMKYDSIPGARGICPEGWHLPTLEEWDEINDNFPYAESGAAIKEGGVTGFNALMAGDRFN